MRQPNETKEEKFRRLAEDRVNRILHLFRLLGNLSWTGTYTYSREQVEQIFTTLQSQERIKKRFSLSEPYDVEDPVVREDHPAFAIQLPDGTYLRAVGFPNDDYPCINIYWDNGINAPTDTLCFVEFNHEKEGKRRVCIGTYRSDEEDTAYYAPYVAAERIDFDE